MTALAEMIAARVAATGPMTLADYMAECLLHPDHGYYATRDPLGQAGDFTTAPEITQMFGELVGLALARAWMDQGALGPGRGTLMADLLRATTGIPGFRDATRLVLVEASAPFRALQERALGEAGPRWADGPDALPEDRPLLLAANEFLDALPIRQFVRDPGGWRERMVTAKHGRIESGLAPPAPIAALDHRLADTEPGEVVELRPALEGVVAAVGERIAAQGGCAIFIDYGDWRSRGDTLQAVAGHAYTDAFEAPGAADLTAHVDFETVAMAARAAGAEAWGPEPQGRWLGRLGLVQRAEALAGGLSDPEARRRHVAAFHRLTDPAEMGTLFKVMALTPPQAPAPPGFAARAADTGRDPAA
jgi:SAM-dependent MidA family methyltransferase